MGAGDDQYANTAALGFWSPSRAGMVMPGQGEVSQAEFTTER